MSGCSRKRKQLQDGRLTGGYYMKQAGGKELNGIMTMEKQSQLNDYAE